MGGMVTQLKFQSKNIVLLIVGIVIALASCATPKIVPYQAKPLDRPEPVHCFDAVGHMPGTYPYIFGGTCCCTPTPELMEQYHRDGFLLDMEYEDLLRAYSDRGIQLESASHKGCNNLCEHGPHVVKGGKCMASPTPGTVNFEEVRFGTRYLSSQQAEEIKKQGSQEE
jgi:hypothetical protein